MKYGMIFKMTLPTASNTLHRYRDFREVDHSSSQHIIINLMYVLHIRVNQRIEQTFLCWEVLIKGTRCKSGILYDIPKRCAVKPVPQEVLFRRVQNVFSCVVRLD